MLRPASFAGIAVMAGWCGLGLALLTARLRQVRATDGSGARRRDLSSWGGLLLQGLGFAYVWGFHRDAGAPFLPVHSPILEWMLATSASVLAIASALFAIAAVRELGKQWSLTARVLETHELIRSGPFSRVRHPIYSALLGLLIATGIAFGSPSWTAIGAAIYLVGTHWRAAREERLLLASFGEAYTDYARRVPRLIPRLTPPTPGANA